MDRKTSPNKQTRSGWPVDGDTKAEQKTATGRQTKGGIDRWAIHKQIDSDISGHTSSLHYDIGHQSKDTSMKFSQSIVSALQTEMSKDMCQLQNAVHWWEGWVKQQGDATLQGHHHTPNSTKRLDTRRRYCRLLKCLHDQIQSEWTVIFWRYWFQFWWRRRISLWRDIWRSVESIQSTWLLHVCARCLNCLLQMRISVSFTADGAFWECQIKADTQMAHSFISLWRPATGWINTMLLLGTENGSTSYYCPDICLCWSVWWADLSLTTQNLLSSNHKR